MLDAKSVVIAHWDREASGERYGDAQDAVRYQLEPEILEFADFPSTKGSRVLEIGVGMGSDFIRFARAGARATGVDITERAVGITAERLKRAGLAGDVRVADAENLPFEAGTFDLVYSWGVLHHTPNTPKALCEAARVLRPGGELRLMLYHRHSWVALAAWIRFGLFHGRPFTSITEAVSHVESPGTKAYRVAEVRAMLRDIEGLAVRPALTHWDRRVAPGLARLAGDRFGWFLLIRGKTRSR